MQPVLWLAYEPFRDTFRVTHIFHVQGSCPILQSSIRAFLKRTTEVLLCAGVASCGTLRCVQSRAQWGHSTGGLRERICLKHSRFSSKKRGFTFVPW